MSVLKNKLLKFFNFIFDKFYDFAFGSKKNVDHIWKSNNYKKYKKFHWHFVEYPLQQRGIYLPLNTHDHLSFKNFKTFFNEHIVLDRYIQLVNDENVQNIFVDIGAGDGIDMSNTFNLVKRGYKGFMIEANNSKFAKMATIYREFDNIVLLKSKVTPKNVGFLMEGFGLPAVTKILNLDIDSYDYPVLKELLDKFKFQFLILEINPIFPMSIDFTVEFSDKHVWSNNLFQGASVSLFYKLLTKYEYSIIHIDRGFVLAINNSYLNEDIKPIELHMIDKVLLESLKNDENIELIKEIRSLPINESIKIIEKLFQNYDNFYLSPSNIDNN